MTHSKGRPMRIGTLFSGIGAPEQAISRVHSEHEIVFACEWDKFARQSYEANYDIELDHFHKDINDMNGKQYAGQVDMVIGGSPCQDFSIAGLRAGVDGHRGQLIWQYFRIIDEVRPPVFIYENVKGMVSDKGGKTLKDFLEIFRSIGYHCHAEVLNTKNYGVPQNRERIYIVGFLDHNHYHRFEYAPKVKLEKRLKDVLEDDVDEKYYLNRKLDTSYESQANTVHCTKKESPTICAETHGYALGYVNVIGKLDIKGDDYIKRIYDTDGLCPTIPTCQGGLQEPKISERQASIRFKTKPDGSIRAYRDDARKSGVSEMQYQNPDNIAMTLTTAHESKIVASRGRNPQNPSDRTAGNHVEQRLEVNESGTSNALTTVQKDNYVLEPTTRIRKLTPRECLRLQDFSDSFKQVVSDSQQYKQAGNSMSANVLEMLFRQIEKAQSDEPTNTLMDFT